MEYLKAVDKIKVNLGDVFKNMKDLDSHLVKIDVRDVERVLVAKEVFDSNLKEDYNKIVASGGMCGYWALIYREYFIRLGFNATLKSVQGEDDLIYSHVWVEIECENYVVELDKLGAVVSEKGKPSNYEKIIKGKFLMDFGKTPHIKYLSDTTTGLYNEFRKVSILEVPIEFLIEFTRYSDYLINSDIIDYTPRVLKDFFIGFQLMYIHLIDTHNARNIKDLIKEKKTRAKYRK